MTTYGPRAEWPGGGLFKEVKIAEEVLLVVTLIGEVGIAGICTIEGGGLFRNRTCYWELLYLRHWYFLTTPGHVLQSQAAAHHSQPVPCKIYCISIIGRVQSLSYPTQSLIFRVIMCCLKHLQNDIPLCGKKIIVVLESHTAIK